MSLIRTGEKLTASHQTIPLRTQGANDVEVRLELESLTGDLVVKLLGCWQKGAWSESTDVWVGASKLTAAGVHADTVAVPAGVDTICLLLEPSQECVVRDCSVRAVR